MTESNDPGDATGQNAPARSLAGRLLVATPALLDPNFHRTVILMCVYGDEGALGIVLNRPSESDVLDHLPEWRHLAASPAVVFSGGPVEPTTALALGRAATSMEADADADAEAEAEAGGWTAVTDRLGLLDLGRAPGELGVEAEQVRIFSGYAGWGAGQLEAEIEEQSWFIVDAAPDDPFTREPERLWREVLRRQPGRLAIFADFPTDPRVN